MMTWDETLQSKIDDLGKSLYHYTTANGLFGILSNSGDESNRTFHFQIGKLSSMNDSKEMLWIIEVLEELLKIDSSYGKDYQERLLQIKERINDYYPYAMCFSQCKDDAAQWDRYADGGKGFCIVFNTANLYQFINSIGDLKKVNYVENATDLQKECRLDLKGMLMNSMKTEKFYDEATEYKHYSFQAEKEERLIITKEHNDFISQPTIKEKSIVSNGIVKDKLDISMNCEILQNIIEGIVIGPKSNQSKQELSNYLARIGLNELSKHVSKSESPLR